MHLLAIDTTTPNAGVALLSDDTSLEQTASVTTHSEGLLPLIDQLCRQAAWQIKQIDAVVCVSGPGSFTGLRIGLGTAKGLCFALEKPLVLVSSLAALAAPAATDELVCATLDAFQKEVYVGWYLGGAVEPKLLDTEHAGSPDQLKLELLEKRPRWIVGSGLNRYPELLTAGVERMADDGGAPRPLLVARLGREKFLRGEFAVLDKAMPNYIRPSEAERKFGTNESES